MNTKSRDPLTKKKTREEKKSVYQTRAEKKSCFLFITCIDDNGSKRKVAPKYVLRKLQKCKIYNCKLLLMRFLGDARLFFL